MADAQRFQLGTIGALGLSVISSVSIVICNKALISTLGFTFGKQSSYYNISLQLLVYNIFIMLYVW